MLRVFISYVSENWPAVDRLAAELRAAGFAVWLDRYNISPGHRWPHAIRDAIWSVDFFIACFSKEYGGRRESYMNEELAIAIERFRMMPDDRAWFIPVVLDESDVPHRSISASEDLSYLQYVRLGGASWDDGLSRILQVLRGDHTTTKQQSSQTSRSAGSSGGPQAITGRSAVVVRSEPGTASLSVLVARKGSVPIIRRSSVFCLAASVLILATTGVLFLEPYPRASEQSYVSHAGERQRFVLPDGSAVTLVGDSVLQTHFSEQARVVILVRGEALFNVRHEPKQLFQVLAGSGSILDVGTEFDVRCYTRGIQVTVIRGAVDVIPRAIAGKGAAVEKTIRVSEGQEITYGRDGYGSALHPSNPHILDWTLLTYEQTPLWKVVEDLQRDVPMSRSIRLDPDSSVSELIYNGTIKREMVDQWIHILPNIFPVEVIDLKPDSIIIRRRN